LMRHWVSLITKKGCVFAMAKASIVIALRCKVLRLQHRED
jgi:hypothetical protein